MYVWRPMFTSLVNIYTLRALRPMKSSATVAFHKLQVDNHRFRSDNRTRHAAPSAEPGGRPRGSVSWAQRQTPPLSEVDPESSALRRLPRDTAGGGKEALWYTWYKCCLRYNNSNPLIKKSNEYNKNSNTSLNQSHTRDHIKRTWEAGAADQADYQTDTQLVPWPRFTEVLHFLRCNFDCMITI